jgi:hypothetical protein
MLPFFPRVPVHISDARPVRKEAATPSHGEAAQARFLHFILLRTSNLENLFFLRAACFHFFLQVFGKRFLYPF